MKFCVKVKFLRLEKLISVFLKKTYAKDSKFTKETSKILARSQNFLMVINVA